MYNTAILTVLVQPVKYGSLGLKVENKLTLASERYTAVICLVIKIIL